MKIMLKNFVFIAGLIYLTIAGCSNKIQRQNDEERIDNIISQLTLEEKINMLHANSLFTSGGVERLGIKELTYDDGPSGVREENDRNRFRPLGLTTDSATFFPTGSALAATWNPDLAYQYGVGLGEESRSRGKEVILGPAVNISRTPVNGRTYEYMSEDPYLNSRLTVKYIQGVQKSNVAACVKHYLANNQETDRNTMSAEMDERTLREIYLPAFKAAVEEGNVYSIMTAYNKFRGTYCAENDHVLNKILKDEWNFKGIVVSDWGGTHSTVNSALNGLDVEMGTRGEYFFAKALLDSVRNNFVPEKIIDDKVRRILRVMSFTRSDTTNYLSGVVSTDEHMKIAYDVACQSIVLLKNSEKLLPLDISKVRRIAVIGDNATHIQAKGGFGAGVKARYEITPLEGLKRKLKDKVEIVFAKGYKPEFVSKPEARFVRFPSDKPDSALIKEAVDAAKNSDIVIIVAGNNREVETEATDRKNLQLPFGQDELIKAVTAANKKTIIVVAAGAPVDLSTATTNSSAILYSWFNGSEGGSALVDVLFGDVNPSGKLPLTFPEKLEDSPAHYLNTFPGKDKVVKYEEGILVGYRWFDTKNIKPQYPFGFGLSYSNFDYGKISTNKKSYSPQDKIRINFKVKNTGKYDGYETVQIYASHLNSKIMRASKELKAFKKIFIKSGEESEIEIELNTSDLAYFDEKENTWIVEPGDYKLLACSSSRDIKSEKQISLNQD